MNKIILTLIVVAVIGAAAFSGFFTPPKEKGNIPATATNTSCLDESAPITTDNVTYQGAQYNLIKSDAHVKEPGKFAEMRNTGAVDKDGHSIYTMSCSNFFGEGTDPNLIFVLQNKEIPPVPDFIFKIYLKDGGPIPEYIKNCKSTGGTIKIVAGDTASFPPDAFNKTDIIGLSEPAVAAAYVYNGNKTTRDFVNGLGARNVGSLKIQAKNTNLPLYFHLELMYLMDGNDAYEYLPTDKPLDLSKSKKSLQLKKIIFVQTPTYSWFTPSCKPAIYLYPTKKQNVNVKVNTTGFFTLTIPDYNNSTGWDVVANPDGTIETNNNQYPYLYYESKVPDSKITKPDKGFVVTRNELPELFSDLLPKLGLNNKESKEFIEYWEKALPNSPYYFVGIMDQKSINQIEPLDINPSPDSIIRIRLYFEILERAINVQNSQIITPQREGFTVVEWGWMVKTDKNSPFTCSQ